MRVLIVGSEGKMGGYHIKACKDLGHEVERCDTRFSPPYIYPHTDYRLIPTDEIDAVIIATPTLTHYEIAKYFINCKGIKRVFIEKPMCEKSAEAYELVELAKRKNVQLMVGHIERFNPVMKNMILNPNYIRDITTVRRGYTPEATSNIISDLMIHDIDNICYILNYNKVPRVIHSIIKGKHFAQALLDYNGIVVSHQVGRQSKRIIREIRVITKEYHYYVDLMNKSLSVYNNVDENSCYGEQSNDDALRAELCAFFDGYDNAEQAYRNVKTCENIMRMVMKWKKE